MDPSYVDEREQRVCNVSASERERETEREEREEREREACAPRRSSMIVWTRREQERMCHVMSLLCV